MGARQKLNQSYFNGSLVLGVIAGLLTQSWLIFFFATCLLLAFNMYQKEIRLSNGPGKTPRRN